MVRPIVAFAALASLAAPAVAGTYSARPIAPAGAKRIIARDIVWNCGAGTCQGSTAESRPAVLCQSLAKRVGRLESFTADGRAFGAHELDRCNAAAKGANPSAAGGD